jgi:quercetin dioxygenase-like cupin family protein
MTAPTDPKTPGNDDALAIRPPPALVDAELALLLSPPFVARFDQQAAQPAGAEALRARLRGRVHASRVAEIPMVTRRLRKLAAPALAQGITQRLLYQATDAARLRPGEPLRVRQFDVAAGQTLDAALMAQGNALSAAASPDSLLACHREWLVMSGEFSMDGQPMGERDYHVAPAGLPTPSWTARRDARLFLRESPALPALEPATTLAQTVRDAEAGWPEFAPGIRRRVLWTAQGQAALLYYAQAGASVPNHTHGHDEECLMVQGDLFLDDLLLQPGDYQLAPAGTGHHITQTDTGVVIYAHGDLDLQFVA